MTNIETNEALEPDTNLTADAIEDESEVIEDPEELARYITEQELLRKTAELTAEEMLSVEDRFLTPEQLMVKTEWRDAVIVMVIAEGVKESFRKILSGQANGTYRNNKFYDGYKQALNDIYEKLIAIVPDNYKDFTKTMKEDQEEKIVNFNEKVGAALNGETNEGTTDSEV